MTRWLSRPVGKIGAVVMGLAIVLAPAWLLRDRLTYYWVYGDDWEYIASSRTLDRTFENLLTTHNVHTVPVWRVVSWVVAASAGRLENLPDVMAMAAFGTLAAVILMTGRLVHRETGRMTVAVAAMVGVGTTSLMDPAGSWYSAAQAAAAGFFILVMLWYLSLWRRSGGWLRLALAILAAWAAGASWTVGHAAGPIGAAYLWADRTPRCRRASVILVLASALVAGLFLWSASRQIAAQSAINFHGRTTAQAVTPLEGLMHTVQAIPERLMLGALGLTAETTWPQAATLLLALVAVWAFSRRGRGPITPLEAAGAAIVVITYAIQWSFRGYLPFSSLRGFVPWYETLPWIGAVLFLAGWGVKLLPEAKPGSTPSFTRAMMLTVLACQAGLIVAHQPRVDAEFRETVHKMTDSEAEIFLITELQHLRARYLAGERRERQLRHLARLDRAEELARELGVGREAFRAVFGRILWPEPPPIDDADLLALPAEGPQSDPTLIQRVFGAYFALEPEPPPPWLNPDEQWPPPKPQTQAYLELQKQMNSQDPEPVAPRSR